MACLLGAHSRYWAKRLTWDGRRGSVIEHNDGESPPIRHSLSLRKIEKGLAALGQKYPHHLGQIMAEEWDGETGAMLLQMVVFGEIKYG